MRGVMTSRPGTPLVAWALFADDGGDEIAAGFAGSEREAEQHLRWAAELMSDRATIKEVAVHPAR